MKVMVISRHVTMRKAKLLKLPKVTLTTNRRGDIASSWVGYLSLGRLVSVAHGLKDFSVYDSFSFGSLLRYEGGTGKAMGDDSIIPTLHLLLQ